MCKCFLCGVPWPDGVVSKEAFTPGVEGSPWVVTWFYSQLPISSRIPGTLQSCTGVAGRLGSPPWGHVNG